MPFWHDRDGGRWAQVDPFAMNKRVKLLGKKKWVEKGNLGAPEMEFTRFMVMRRASGVPPAPNAL